MSIGQLLLQPQAINRALQPSKENTMDALIALSKRLTALLSSGGDATTSLFENLIAEIAQELIEEMEPRIGKASIRLNNLATPFTRLLNVFEGAGIPQDDASFMEVARQIMTLIKTELDKINTASIRSFLEQLLILLESDLGITEENIKNLLPNLLQRICDRLKQAYLGGENNAQARDLFLLASNIEQIVEQSKNISNLPGLNKEEVLKIYDQAMTRFKLEDRLNEGKAFLARLCAIFESANNLAECVQQFVGTTVPVDFNPLVFANMTPSSGTPEEEEDNENKACYYASWLNGRIIQHPSPTDNPHLFNLQFECIEASGMECWAFHTRWITNFAEAILHFSSIEKEDIVSNLTIGMFATGEGAANLFFDIPFPEYLKWIFRPFLQIFNSIEGGARCNDAFYVLLLLQDGLESILYARWTWLFREALLSIFTLSNHNKDAFEQILVKAQEQIDQNTNEAEKQLMIAELERFKRIHNYNHVDGISQLLSELFLFFYALCLSEKDKEDYGLPGEIGEAFTTGYIYLLHVFGIGGMFLGPVLGRLISGEWVDDHKWADLLFKKRMFQGIGSVGAYILFFPTYFVDFLIYYYMIHEGDTEDGKYSGRTDASGNTIRYAGYADKSTSPYLLPYEAGETYQCIQGNQGIITHSEKTSSRSGTYSFDFTMDAEDEILAMRDGVVWSFVENTPNDEKAPSGVSGTQANSVTVLHDPPSPDLEEHDSFELNGGNRVPIRTMAVYLHGRLNGVTNAFSAPGNDIDLVTLTTAELNDTTIVDGVVRNQLILDFAAVNIDATTQSIVVERTGSTTSDYRGPVRVQQGQFIMEAGNTGNSAINHIHISIRPARVDASNNVTGEENFTIPFVFADDDAEDNGVPLSLNYYTSDNEKV